MESKDLKPRIIVKVDYSSAIEKILDKKCFWIIRKENEIVGIIKDVVLNISYTLCSTDMDIKYISYTGYKNNGLENMVKNKELRKIIKEQFK